MARQLSPATEDIESKGPITTTYTPENELSHGINTEIISPEELNLSRSLKQRHIQMIALAGAIVCLLVSDGLHTLF